MSYISLQNAYKSIYNEDVSVTFEDESGSIQTFRLQDEYAKILKRRIQADSGNIVDKIINKIFNDGDWGGSKQGPSKGVLKDIALNANYDLSIELLDYLSNNKESLLKLSNFGIGKVKNIVDLIKLSIPSSYIKPGIDNFIKQIHLSVIPKASTGVGRGEGTFTFFGTAKKGKSGDLNWDGYEVEIKTGGDANSGAILGGDGYLNKVTDRLEKTGEYTHLKISDLNAIETAMNRAVASLATNGSQEFERFKELYKKKNIFKSDKLNKAILDSTLNDFINQQITRNEFTPLARPNPSNNFTLYTALQIKIEEERQSASKLKVNLPSQIAMYLSDDNSVDDFVKVFSELRTYEYTSINLKEQLSKFFKTHNYTDFNPKNDYNMFSTLVGAIALVSYIDKTGFDLMFIINDRTMEGVIINCTNNDLTTIYTQLERIPRLQFNLNIDPYEGGKSRSQVVIAKSPRIKLV